MDEPSSGDGYGLIQKMRNVFEEVISMLKDDEARLRDAYYELQHERDAMRSELDLWRAMAQQWNEERRYYQSERERWQSAAALSSPQPPPPRPSGAQRDRLSKALREAPPAPPATTATTPPREHGRGDNIPCHTEGGASIDYDYYDAQRGERSSPPPRDEHAAPLPADVKHDPLERESTARYAGESNRKGEKETAAESDSRRKDGAVATLRSHPPEDLVNSSTNTGHGGERLPNCFWIYVWPAFGNTAPLYLEPAKVFVYGHYRYMEDVTEKAAKALHCQPAPSCLHEPDGTPVRTLRLLIPNQHYIIFPSGAYYRHSAVPQRLLDVLVRNAQQVLHESPY